MAPKSTLDHYGTIAVSIHWISVALILFLIGSGFRAASIVDPVAKASILRLHVPIAVAVLALTILCTMTRRDGGPSICKTKTT